MNGFFHNVKIALKQNKFVLKIIIPIKVYNSDLESLYSEWNNITLKRIPILQNIAI